MYQDSRIKHSIQCYMLPMAMIREALHYNLSKDLTNKQKTYHKKKVKEP